MPQCRLVAGIRTFPLPKSIVPAQAFMPVAFHPGPVMEQPHYARKTEDLFAFIRSLSVNIFFCIATLPGKAWPDASRDVLSRKHFEAEE